MSAYEMNGNKASKELSKRASHFVFASATRKHDGEPGIPYERTNFTAYKEQTCGRLVSNQGAACAWVWQTRCFYQICVDSGRCLVNLRNLLLHFLVVFKVALRAAGRHEIISRKIDVARACTSL